MNIVLSIIVLIGASPPPVYRKTTLLVRWKQALNYFISFSWTKQQRAVGVWKKGCYHSS
jgi:hypothetical protein